MKTVFASLVLLSALPLIGGYLGWLHPLGDSLGVFRLQGAGLLAVVSALALFAGAATAGRLGMVLALVAGVPLAWSYQGDGAPGGDLRLYQKNMLFRNDDLSGLQADIRAAAPDVLTLQEVSDPNRALLADLADLLPHQHWCPFAAVGGTAIATRLPPVPGEALCAPGLAALKVTGPKGPLWLVSVHLHWPWPYGQAAHVANLLPAFEGMEAPVVMAGDFNMVPWSDALAALRHATGTTHAGPVRGTYTGFQPLLTLPIDHVLSPGGGAMETRPGLGSDHLGLLADLSLQP
jgi:endonuclease/exonuclease/phosphatase (EEP) superfamily protein YafD